jgi:microsomal dipeptidase-like Zn-dependent dipeptidase
VLRRLARIVLFIICLLAIFDLALPRIVEERENPLLKKPPYRASERAHNLHRQLTIADLHADSLLWGRDLLARSSYGQIDIPRLVEGNVTLQVFSLPTKSPRGLNIDRNDDTTDMIRLLAIAERWPVATWGSLTERALYQSRRLHQMAKGSSGRFTLVENAEDLSRYLALRQSDPNITAGLLSIEGAHALDGRIANLDVLYRAGYRMMAPSHFFDNDIGGSSAGVRKTGLTDKGREWVRQMEARHMIIDLAHASAKTIDDVLGIATRPVVVSHTGVKGTCNNNRNLSDDQISAVARNGGLIGIGYWDTATCGTDARAIVKAMRYVSDRVGVEHVALGSDFDGAIDAPFDTTGLIQITDAMLENGYSEEEIRSIMGENAIRLLQTNLPER